VDRVSTFSVTFHSNLGPMPVVPSAEPRSRLRGDRRQAILDLLRQRGELARSEIADALGISDDATRKWLHTLREEQRIALTTASARSRQARYRAVSPQSSTER
jgi:predicted ArsR family transcriptional regulator